MQYIKGSCQRHLTASPLIDGSLPSHCHFSPPKPYKHIFNTVIKKQFFVIYVFSPRWKFGKTEKPSVTFQYALHPFYPFKTLPCFTLWISRFRWFLCKMFFPPSQLSTISAQWLLLSGTVRSRISTRWTTLINLFLTSAPHSVVESWRFLSYTCRKTRLEYESILWNVECASGRPTYTPVWCAVYGTEKHLFWI